MAGARDAGAAPDAVDGHFLRRLQEQARRIRVGELSLAELSPPQDECDHAQLVEALLRSSFDGIVLNSRKSRWILEVSDSFCELTGYSRDELIGWTSVEVGLVEQDAARSEVTQRLDEGQEGQYETWLQRKDGERRRVEFAHQLLDPDCVLTIVRDVTPAG